MIKKVMLSMIILVCLLPACLLRGGRVPALVNSAEPIEPDDGSGIAFKQHQHIQILSEVLDIKINDNVTANITATYIIKNSSEDSLNVETMFLTPMWHMENRNKNISVKSNGEDLDFEQEFFGTYSYGDNNAKTLTIGKASLLSLDKIPI